MSPELHGEIAHDVDDLKADIAFERGELGAAITHDYSTAETGIVPLSHRRPMWHFLGLWTTFVAGFSYMFLGFEIHDGGHSLASTAAITLIGYGKYLAYPKLRPDQPPPPGPTPPRPTAPRFRL